MKSCLIVLVVFFFSSRRRHTRYWRDWSSDVCSSDLARLEHPVVVAAHAGQPWGAADQQVVEEPPALGRVAADEHQVLGREQRSEERRVGKECRSRWSPYH